MDRPDLRHGAGLRAGQPRHPAVGARLDFLRFCQLNPKPCPLIGRARPAIPGFRRLAPISTSAPICRYNVLRNGELVDEPTDITKHWRDDLVIFALGCSFSFEDALIEDGIELRQSPVAQRADVPHQYSVRAGRPVPRPDGRVDAAAEARRRHPRGADHVALSLGPWRAGASRHAGAIGIKDIVKPDYGDPPE